jgi:hypothetical protein
MQGSDDGMTTAEQRNGREALYCRASITVANWIALDIPRPNREAREVLANNPNGGQTA